MSTTTANTTSNSNNNASEIQLDSMSLEQLNQLKQQEEGRLQALMSHYSSLRQAAAKLQASQQAVHELGPATDGKDVMVPLTESVYVPGRVKDPNKLLVDLGTDFYVEKSSKETIAYLDRRMRLVEANSENVTTVIQGTRGNLEAITMAMQGKLLEIRARQEGARHRAAAEGSE